MEKQTKTTFYLLGSAVFAVLFHNLIYELFGVEEPVFFSLALLLALVFVVSVAADVYSYLNKGKPKDIWKLGWLGLLGLFGAITGNLAFTAFYVFFAFFGFKK